MEDTPKWLLLVDEDALKPSARTQLEELGMVIVEKKAGADLRIFPLADPLEDELEEEESYEYDPQGEDSL